MVAVHNVVVDTVAADIVVVDTAAADTSVATTDVFDPIFLAADTVEGDFAAVETDVADGSMASNGVDIDSLDIVALGNDTQHRLSPSSFLLFWFLVELRDELLATLFLQLLYFGVLPSRLELLLVLLLSVPCHQLQALVWPLLQLHLEAPQL